MINTLDELTCVSKDAASDAKFTALGLTDTAIAKIATDGLLVVTADYKLFGILRHRQVDAINVNHLRQISWQLG